MQNKSLTNRIADFFETLEENLEENFPFFIQVMMKQVLITGLLVFKKK